MIGIMFLIMILMIFAGVPVAFSILGSGIFFLLETGMKPLTLVCQRAVTGLDSFPLLAVPLFVFVGDLIDRGGIYKRMIKWAESLLGWLPGGLGIVTIVSCAIFAALTGSGPATVAAIGSIMIPSLVKNGYPIKTAAGYGCGRGRTGADYSAQYSDDYLRGNHERIHPQNVCGRNCAGGNADAASDWSQCGNCSA